LSTHTFFASRVENEYKNVTADFSFNLHSPSEYFRDKKMFPDSADLTIAHSANVLRGVIDTEPINAGIEHKKHRSRTGNIIYIN
jgi:hypothetical protein